MKEFNCIFDESNVTMSAPFDATTYIKGDKGDKGDKGEDGKDGTSPSASVAQTESGATITITDASGTTTAKLTNGKDGADGAKGDKGEQGEKGADGKDGANGTNGIDGKDGYTPIRGTDYWTEADKTEIVNEVLAALPDGTEVSY